MEESREDRAPKTLTVESTKPDIEDLKVDLDWIRDPHLQRLNVLRHGSLGAQSVLDL